MDNMTTEAFDVLTTTASDLQLLLEEGKITSIQIVAAYQRQVEKYNDNLHAILSISPKLTKVAQKLDEERQQGKLRGPLHGVAILVKDAFNTVQSMGMPTTIGSFALKESQVTENAALIDALLKQGLILLGKANLTEVLSAVGGMCQSGYIPGGFKPGEKRRGETAPGGSSTGSAVGVAAGFSPLSLGTETSGSLTPPSSRAALYALKLTPGTVSTKGAWQVTSSFDTAGGMAKSVRNLALLSDVLLQHSNPCRKSLVTLLKEHWDGLSVGFVDIELWRLPADARGDVPEYNEQSVSYFNGHPQSPSTYKVIKEHGVDVIVASCDSFFAGIGVGANYPLASIPFSYVKSSGRPYGLHVIARANEEDNIIHFMSVWEKTVAPPKPPNSEKL